MATLLIIECDELARDSRGDVVMCPVLPPVAQQVVTFSTSTQSNTLNKRTTFVFVKSSAAARLEVNANPTASLVSSAFGVAADAMTYFGVRPGTEGANKIAAIAES